MQPTAADASNDAKQPNTANFPFAPPWTAIPPEIQVSTGALLTKEYKSEDEITPTQLDSPSGPQDMESSMSTPSEKDEETSKKIWPKSHSDHAGSWS